MKITDETPARLVLLIMPWALIICAGLFVFLLSYALFANWHLVNTGGQLLGVGVIGAILWGINLFVHRVETSFTRTNDRIEIWRRGLVRDMREIYPLHLFRQAVVDESAGDSDGGPTCRLVLQFDEKLLDLPETEGITRRKRQSGRFVRVLAPNEVPLTNYYATQSRADEIARRINAWADQWVERR